jgi:4-hydroxythreonine-4-phosphate dehydrogenase
MTDARETAASPRATDGRTRPLAVTMGDPAGIGLDITLAAWADRARRPLPEFVLYADPDALAERQRALRQTSTIRIVSAPAELSAGPANALAVIPTPVAEPVVAGLPNPANGAAVIVSIEQAVAAAVAGDTSAVVTHPISKQTLYAAGFKHPGHTEFLAELAARHTGGPGPTPVMMLACDELRVVPLTIHVPLADVPHLITPPAILEAVRITASALRRDFGIAAPRIAVAGLNPHAGEGGAIGREDADIIAPAVAKLRSEGLDVRGPLSADTMFHAAARRTYDAAIAMYHDQALIPIKTLAFDLGVNVTLGLPFVRTSPDHGTAFDIAGKGIANPTSFVEALWLAQRMAEARADAADATAAS